MCWTVSSSAILPPIAIIKTKGLFMARHGFFGPTFWYILYSLSSSVWRQPGKFAILGLKNAIFFFELDGFDRPCRMLLL
jgi:hypothetical protein